MFQLGTDCTRLLQLNPFRAVALTDIVSLVACMSWICSSNLAVLEAFDPGYFHRTLQ